MKDYFGILFYVQFVYVRVFLSVIWSVRVCMCDMDGGTMCMGV